MSESAPPSGHANGRAVRLAAPVPEALEVGRGVVLVLRGTTALPAGRRPAWFTVELGGARRRLAHPRDLVGAGAEGFWLPIAVPGHLASGARLTVRLRLTDGTRLPVVDQALGLRPRARPPELPRRASTAICLATYNPDPRLFRRQVASLRAQTHKDFVCLVQDDGSAAERFAEVARTCAEDPRFFVFRGEANVGFYRNFEACLARVPESVEYVALCDQDDAWYPDKLAACLTRLRGAVQLVYSDMRLVDREGRVLAGTYWSERRNNYRSFETLLVANTVTGAASVFRRGLLDVALPFPEPSSATYHDHWLACAAMVTGGLDYIDRPLYDYTQHGANVIGYCGFPALGIGQALRSHAAALRGALASPSVLRAQAKRALDYHDLEYRKLLLYRLLLELRVPDLSPAHRRSLAVFSDRVRDAAALIGPAHLGVLLRGDTTNMAELKLGVALALKRGVRPIAPAVARWL
jgi:glycosyltransferase involved in cell wall biosynthesis